MLLNISQRKGNQAIKSGQLIKYNKIFFFKNHTQNGVGKLVTDFSLFFKKALIS